MINKKAVMSALKKVEMQQDNYGFMDKFDLDEHWAVREVLEKYLKEDSDTKSHNEIYIVKQCISLMHELVDDFAKWYEFMHGEDAISELDEEELFCVSKSYFSIVQSLLLYNTSHSGGTSTRSKCEELGFDWSDSIYFAFETEEEE